MRRLAASVAVLALVLAPAASSHPAFQPSFAPQRAESALMLVIPNERRAPMTALELVAPPSVDVLAAEATGGWRGAVAGRRASWTGRRLRPQGIAQVVVRVRPTGAAGAVTFRVRQRFADGRLVDWPLQLTVTPGSAGGDGGLRGVAFAVVGVAGAATVAFVIWLRRRRRGTLQET